MAKAEKAKDKSKKNKPEIYKNYIGGEWVKSSSGEYFENLNPADTSDVVGRFPRSTKEDVDAAVAAAKDAATKWRRTPAPKRAARRSTVTPALLTEIRRRMEGATWGTRGAAARAIGRDLGLSAAYVQQLASGTKRPAC